MARSKGYACSAGWRIGCRKEFCVLERRAQAESDGRIRTKTFVNSCGVILWLRVQHMTRPEMVSIASRSHGVLGKEYGKMTKASFVWWIPAGRCAALQKDKMLLC